MDFLRRQLNEPSQESWYLMAVRSAIYEVNLKKGKKPPPLDVLKLAFGHKDGGRGAGPFAGMTEWEYRDAVRRKEIDGPSVRRYVAEDLVLMEKRRTMKKVFGKDRWKDEWEKVRPAEEAKVEEALRSAHEAERGDRPWEDDQDRDDRDW